MKTSFNKTNPKRILGYLMAFAMVLFSANAFSQCDHTLNMYDAYGDGWNGSSVDVTVNGAVVVAGATITAAQGSANSETFSASSGDAIDLANWVTGSWTSEVSWDITDGDGTVIASGVHNGSGASTGYCAPAPPCGHALNMYDAYGDGWNGSSVDVTVNGAVVVAGATITAAQGAANSESFSAASGDAIDLANWVTGSWTSEVSWDITDGGGTVIASGVHNGSGASVGNCPSVIAGCMDPTASNYNSSATVDDGSCVWINPPSCCNTTQYGAGAAPLSGTATISTCNYLSEYSPISGCVAGQLYTLEVTGAGAAPGWIVVTEGTACGNMLAEGPSPLEFTAGSDPAIFAHWMADSCVTAGGCHVTTITLGSYVYGCTNPAASNYDPSATHDDGSCVLAGCTSGIGANSESFEDPAVPLYGQGPWANWAYDATNSTFTGTNGWRKDNLGTGSGGTGPTNGAPSLDGAYYLYCETSGQYGKVGILNSSCVDLTNFVDPTFVAGYNMEGATMGTLNIDVSTDGGTSWTTEWTLSGNQGAGWNEALVSLSAYAGQMVQVRMHYTSGTSFTGDCAIDFLRFMEAPVSGCMDPNAANYDPNATIDDGSCQYIGCMDPGATNYDPQANVACAACCLYPASNLHPFCEDVESGSSATNGWLIANQPYATAMAWGGGATFVVNAHPGANGPIAGSYSMKFEGGDAPTGWTAYTTEAQAYANVTHVSSATIMVDFGAAGPSCEMSFSLDLFSGFANVGYSNMRVSIGGVVLADVNGVTCQRSNVAPWTGACPAGTVTYNMSAYSGSTVSVMFEFAGKYSTNYSSGLYGNVALVDDICFYDLSPCSYYAAAASSTDVTCNGGSDGSASASASGGSGSDTYSWDNGGTTASISGLAAGTYCCIVTDATLGCVDTVCAVVGEPAAISLSAVIGNESAPGAMDGQINLSVSGGTPCQTSATVLSGTHASAYNSTFTRGWYFQAQSSFTVSGLMCPDDAAPGIATNQSVAIVDYGTTSPVVAFALPSLAAHGNSYAVYDVAGGWVTIPGGFPVIAGNYYGLIGAAHAPGSTTLNNSYGTGGLSVVLDGIPTIQGRLGIQGGIGLFAPGGAGGGGLLPTGTNTLTSNTTWGTPAGSIGRIHIQTGVVGALAYNFAWSNGAASQSLANVGAGTYSVTATDCAGCSATASYTVIMSATPGCMDATAYNYNALATVDDGSCYWIGCMDAAASNYDPTATEGCCGPWAAGTWMNGNPNGVGGAPYVIGGANDGSWSMDTMVYQATTSSVTDPVTGYVTITSVYVGGLTSCEYTGAATSTNVSTHDPANGYAIVGPVTFTVTGTGGFSFSSIGTFTGLDAAGNLLGTLAASSGTSTTCCTYDCAYYGLQDITVVVTTNPWPGEVSWDITDANGAVVFASGGAGTGVGTFNLCLDWGCYNFNMYDSYGDGWNGSAYTVSNTGNGTVYSTGTLSTGFTGSNAFCMSAAVPGCTDPAAGNYNPAATVDDGSCCLDNWVTLNMTDTYGDGWNGSTWSASAAGGNSYGPFGLLSGLSGSESFCMTDDCYDIVCGGGSWMSEVGWTLTDASGATIASGGAPYNAQSAVGAASCGTPGCMDSTASNYNPLATIDDGSCIPCVYGCTIVGSFNYDASATCDDGSCQPVLMGCTDPAASNYYSSANVDDGSCVYLCGSITGVNMTDVIHDRATFNWNDMNNSVAPYNCVVDQIRIQYRAVGTMIWALKTMGAPVGNNAPCLNTSKRVLNLAASTQYEYAFKIWYQDGTVVGFDNNGTFTTAAACDNATNVTATPVNSTKTDFCWTNPASHEFVRLKYREDVPGSSFSNIGGFGVMAPATCKQKAGLTPGLNYRVMWRTWCNVSGGPYRSPVWDGPVLWTQPSSIRVEGGTTINNLDVYPNPSRDIFNVTFTSEDVQNLEVRIINVIGEVVYTENLEQFVGQYTKQVDLATYTKGVYFLEITTDNGVINKKLILQ